MYRAARGENLKAGGLVRHADPGERHFAVGYGDATDFGIEGCLIRPAGGNLIDLGEHSMELHEALQAPMLALLQGLLTRRPQDVAGDDGDVFEPLLLSGIGQPALAPGQREGADQAVFLPDRMAPTGADGEIARDIGEIGPAAVVLGIIDIHGCVMEGRGPAGAESGPGGQAVEGDDQRRRGAGRGKNAEPAILTHHHDAGDPPGRVLFREMTDPSGQEIGRKPGRQIPQNRGLNLEQVVDIRFVTADLRHREPMIVL